MKFDFAIIPNSSVPIYLQIVNGITRMIEDGILVKGSRLPAINKLCSDLGVGRVTVVNAYRVLKEREIIASSHGKGFFVKRPSAVRLKRLFLLFDAMNGYKEVLYRSFTGALGRKYSISIYFYYYNYKEFCRIIKAAAGHYDHYVILPHFNYDVSAAVKCIPTERLLLMDNNIEALNGKVAAIYQNFHGDTFGGLTRGKELIGKYRQFNMVLQDKFQFIPNGIINGFLDFCKNNQINHRVLKELSPEMISRDQAYFVISDTNLITIIRYIKDHNLSLGHEIGIISYDDTPLKSVLENGITAISTDFVQMGRMAAKMIKEEIKDKIGNPGDLIIRNSL
jgi:DNA-binding transcriptional regulator YhcF (GntR family)